MPHSRLVPEFTFTAEHLERLKAVVPEAFADGKVNWEALRESLGDYLEPDQAGAEHFGLLWPGKREARRLAALPSRGALLPAAGEGVKDDTTNNFLIEGDNLEVLKLLQKAYAGLIRLIYIDPPYNTGGDFIYNDDFTDPLGDYLRKGGAVDKEGRPLTTNTRADGRFHSNWLSMMYPRLRLARSLLSDDGSMWISIDDGEVSGLRALCNELFGEENFVATFIWEKRTTRENRRVFSFNHDYVVCYAKDKDVFQAKRNLLPLSQDALSRYKNPDNDLRGPWQSVSLNAQSGHATPAQFYKIITPSGRELDPPPGTCWRVTEPRLEELIRDNRIWFGERGNGVPRRKVFLSEAREGLTPHTLWKADEVGTTDSAKKELMQLFDDKAVYDTPKPVKLLARIVQIATSDTDLVLDFFAGSCTTAQAVMEANRADGGSRRYLCIQMPEPVEADSVAAKTGYATIAEIGKERIRRAIRKLNTEAKPKPNEELGFRVLNLTKSHFKAWENYAGEDLQQLQMLFDAAQDPLVNGWTPKGILCEIMLLEGFPLDSTLSELPGTQGSTVVVVTSEHCAHRLLFCLDQRFENSTGEGLELHDQDVLVCLDAAMTDQAKQQLADRCTLKTI
jgi:adenine-specific DNA-methyltransferase